VDISGSIGRTMFCSVTFKIKAGPAFHQHHGYGSSHCMDFVHVKLLVIKSAGQKYYFKFGTRSSSDYIYAEDTATIPDQGTTSLSSKC